MHIQRMKTSTATALTTPPRLEPLEMTQNCSRSESSLPFSGRSSYDKIPSSAKQGTMNTASPRGSDHLRRPLSSCIDTVSETLNSTPQTVPGDIRLNHADSAGYQMLTRTTLPLPKSTIVVATTLCIFTMDSSLIYRRRCRVLVCRAVFSYRQSSPV